MNLQHLKYAVEVEKTGSITQAAENLYMGQPNLSKAIKELEGTLGVVIFKRTSKGVLPTEQGKEFLRYAKSILDQVERMEDLYRSGGEGRLHFSAAVPRASYIAHAFTNFTCRLPADMHTELTYKETNALRTIQNLLTDEYKLGIIRYASQFDTHFKSMLEEKNFNYELIAEYSHVIVLSAESPLAKKDDILPQDLREYTQIVYSDLYVPSVPLSLLKKEELPDPTTNKICVFERASQFNLLSHNPATFLFASPIPPELLSQYHLVQKRCPSLSRMYRDVLVHRRDYALTELDRLFIEEVVRLKRRIFIDTDTWE